MSPSSLIHRAATAAVTFADWLLSPRAAIDTARTMLPENALWSLSGRDVSGPIAVTLWPLPNGRLGMAVVVDGHLRGLQVSRADVQAARHALTTHLVTTAKTVRS